MNAGAPRGRVGHPPADSRLPFKSPVNESTDAEPERRNRESVEEVKKPDLVEVGARKFRECCPNEYHREIRKHDEFDAIFRVAESLVHGTRPCFRQRSRGVGQVHASEPLAFDVGKFPMMFRKADHSKDGELQEG